MTGCWGRDEGDQKWCPLSLWLSLVRTSPTGRNSFSQPSPLVFEESKGKPNTEENRDVPSQSAENGEWMLSAEILILNVCALLLFFSLIFWRRCFFQSKCTLGNIWKSYWTSLPVPSDSNSNLNQNCRFFFAIHTPRPWDSSFPLSSVLVFFFHFYFKVLENSLYPRAARQICLDIWRGTKNVEFSSYVVPCALKHK